MGQKSLATRLYEETKELYKEQPGSFLVLYDFPKEEPASDRFYDNMHGVIDNHGGHWIQRSAFMTESYLSAVTVYQLAQHYGAAKIQIFVTTELSHLMDGNENAE